MQTRAIIGLGNPGRQYQNTRHNCGFRFIGGLASQCQVTLETQSTTSVSSGTYEHQRRFRLAGTADYLHEPKRIGISAFHPLLQDRPQECNRRSRRA